LTLDLDSFALLLVFAPFIAAALAPLVSGETGRGAGWILAIVPAGICVALSTLLGDIAAGKSISFAVDWVPVLGLRFSLLVDGLSLTFALLISGIGAVIIVYSASYLEGHAHRGRFLAFMLMFTGAMLGLVLADSLVGLVVFWELSTLTSFLLIGFDHTREAARRGAFQALVVTGAGGLALLAGVVLLHVISGAWDISALLDSPGLRNAGAAYPWVLGFVVFAAFTKSAQVPFHFWLPNAMEAPTPVSAFLHSATMVQAGVYLLARMSPLLAGTPQWQFLLCGAGGLTLLWGAICALKETDLKQILAQTTIASLGLFVLLLGLGGEAAALAVAACFVAHALYKAALFLVAGIIDHGTGTRDITALGGLRDSLTITFIAAALAALSMFGLPPFLGYLAKETSYFGLGTGDFWGTMTLVVMVLGNGLLGGVALVLGFRPFMGALKPTPETPHEGSFALWIGPVAFGLMGFAAAFGVDSYGAAIVGPMAAAIAGHPVESHIGFALDVAGLPFWLSICTWALALITAFQLDRLRAGLVALSARFAWTFDRGFDQVMFGLIRLAGGWTRLFQHGRLELYMVLLVACLALVLLAPLTLPGAVLTLPDFVALEAHEWGAVLLAAAGVVAVVASRSRLGAIVALGIQGLAVALIFLFFGAPDLGFTQLMVESLSVVVLALVMTRLHLEATDLRPWEDLARDGVLALVAGCALTLLLLRVLAVPFNGRLSDFFVANSAAVAHGRNIVNVILVDFRGLDTLGEISVVMTAGIGILALLRRQHKRRPETDAPAPAVSEKLGSVA
jgi:multicomponent Na+:H+ antiporter subunit A